MIRPDNHTKTISFCMPGGLGLGGSNLWSLQIGQALAQRGWTANVLVHRGFDKSPRMDSGAWPDVGLIPVPGAYPGKSPQVWDIWRYTRVYQRVLPGIIVPNWSEGTYEACDRLVRRRRQDIRVLSVVHGMNPEHRALAVRYESGISKFIAVSEEIAACLREAMPDRAEDILVRSCPVEVPDRLERTWSEQGSLRLVYAGRITNYEKKVSRLIPLAELLVKAGVDFCMDIYGDGGYLPTLKAECASASEAARVRVKIHGHFEPGRMPEIWRGADVCLLVSDSEGSPLCVMEAMAQGCVPLAMRVSGVPALVRDNVTGWSVDVGDLSAMVEHVRRLDHQRAHLQRLGRQAYAHAHEGFNVKHYVPWFEQLLGDLCSS